MFSLTQPQLQRKVETLLTNGRLPDGRGILTESGCTQEDLDEGDAKYGTWMTNRHQRQVFKGEQTRATQIQNDAFDVAYLDLTDLTQRVRRAFKGNTVVLTKLDLMPQATTQTAETNGKTTPRKARRQSKSLAAHIDRWRLLCTNLKTLDEAENARLVKAKVTLKRIDQALALVEAVAEADSAQQLHIQAYRAKGAQVQQQEKELRRWYGDVIAMLKLTIKQCDPHNQNRYNAMFDL
jgi:hypothetical protein